MKKIKRQYWYITDVDYCVICGSEMRYKHRVYIKPHSSINWIERACNHHYL